MLWCSEKASSKLVGNLSIRRMDKGTNQKDDRTIELPIKCNHKALLRQIIGRTTEPLRSTTLQIKKKTIGQMDPLIR